MTTEDPPADSEGAAFGAPGHPQEEARFDALELLGPIEPKEEDVPIEDILQELAQPDEAVDSPGVPDASAEDHPETEHLASEIETNNSAAVNTETIEESLAALDLEPKEELILYMYFEAEPEPVAEVVEASVEASGPATTEAASSSSAVFAPVFVQHFDNFVDDGEVPPPPTSPFLAAEGGCIWRPNNRVCKNRPFLHPAHLNLHGRGATKQARPSRPLN